MSAKVYVALNGYIQGLGFSLAQCGNHKGRMERAKSAFYETQNAITQLKKEKDNLLNGEQQAMYDNLKQKQEKLGVENGQLRVQIEQAYLLRDAWVNNPEQQAQLEGLGWGWFKRNFVKPFNNAVSCDKWTNEQAEWERKTLPLNQEKGVLEGQISEIRKKTSPENLNLMQKAIQELEIEKGNLTHQLDGILKEIENARNGYHAKKEAERLALVKGKTKQGNMGLFFGGLLLFGLGTLVVKKMKSNPKKATVSM
ncbi:hypothetical protein ACILE2_10900 [Capnocytophaga canimorsus]|uniref:hypothetical protein n=1 Tax=Capnocytophaga canimorsus TaxID=28188 RepID=UPI0037D7AD9C